VSLLILRQYRHFAITRNVRAYLLFSDAQGGAEKWNIYARNVKHVCCTFFLLHDVYILIDWLVATLELGSSRSNDDYWDLRGSKSAIGLCFNELRLFILLPAATHFQRTLKLCRIRPNPLTPAVAIWVQLGL